MRDRAAHGRPFVPRGVGHRAGRRRGAAGDEPVVIVTTKMNRILEVDVDERVAWVEPGVLNLDLSRAVAPPRAALRPRSVEPAVVLDRRQRGQQLGRAALPRLRRHQRARARARGRAARRRGRGARRRSTPSPPGYDLRGAFVGSEGTMGIATRIAVRLTPNPPAVRTMLLDFNSVGRRGRDGERHHRRRASCPPRSR